MKTTSLRHTLLYPVCLAVGAVALVSAIPNAANATQTVRELWDGPNSKFALDGAWGDGVSSLGFAPRTNWVASPAGNTSFRYDGTWNLDWMIGDGDTLLPYSVGQGGTLAYYSNDGNMGSSLINPATGLSYGDYYSQCYATRALTNNAYINFQADGTYYFCVRFIGGGGFSWWSGDLGGGVGFASSDATNADFVGAGWTRNSYLAEDGVTDIGKSAYVTTGTLDQAGIASHPDDSGGPYYARTNGPAGSLPAGGAFIVGKLVTTPSGASTISVKMYNGYQGPDTDPNAITWDATYSFTETNTMTRLLLWQYGTGPSVQDAVRVGTAYSDVIGVEIVGAPNASPGKTVYAGTPVTFSTTYAGLNTGTFPMSYQWLSNGVPLTDATNSTLVLTGTTTNFTADYSLAVANAYGATTSAVTHLTVNPASPVTILQQPVSLTRYLGSPAASFTVVVDGTPPFTYQWKHAGTNIQSAVTTTMQTNTLVLPPITPADAGDYFVTITNLFRTTNSAVATLTEIVPTPGSFAAAVTALSPWGYWRMDDNGSVDPTIYDYFGAYNGIALDPGNMTFGAAGAPYVGFPAPHNATYIGNQWWAGSYRLNLPKLPIYTTNMTFTMWVNTGGGCQLLADNGYGNEYGLQNNNGDVQFTWGGITAWDSGLQVPANTWTFVALVVEPTQATVYVGTSRSSLVSSVDSGLTLSDSTTLNDTSALTPLAVGRNPQPWAETPTPPSQWASQYGTWSDVAIFYQTLTAQQVANLYVAGAGVWIDGTPDGAGNLNLNWVPGGILQEANAVTGPYTDVSGSPTPPYSVPISTAIQQHYYRVKR